MNTHKISLFRRRFPFFRILVLSLQISLCSSNTVLGNMQLSFPFGNNRVLQREINTPVRGTAGPGEEVTVIFNGQSHTAIADGNWEVFLDPMIAGGPFTFIAQSINNTLTLPPAMLAIQRLAGARRIRI